MTISNKIIHPSYYFKYFYRYIFINFFLSLLQLLWGILIFFVNHYNTFYFYVLIKKIINWNFDWLTIFLIAKIYSMYSILHSLYIIISCIMSHVLKSKNWFFSSLYFNLFPLVGFLFGFLQVPYSIYILKKLNSKNWKIFFKYYDTFQSMKNE